MVKNKNKSYKKRKNQSRDTHYGALVLVFFIAALGTCGFFAWKQHNEKNQGDDTPVAADSRNINTAQISNGVNNEGEAETEDTTYVKDLAEKDAETKEIARNENNLKIAEVYMANYGQDTQNNVVFASGVITNVVNNTGTCTYTFTNGDQTVTATSEVLPSAKETVCASVDVDASKFTAGEWTVKLNFKSDYAEGESDATPFTIQ